MYLCVCVYTDSRVGCDDERLRGDRKHRRISKVARYFPLPLPSGFLTRITSYTAASPISRPSVGRRPFIARQTHTHTHIYVYVYDTAFEYTHYAQQIDTRGPGRPPTTHRPPPSRPRPSSFVPTSDFRMIDFRRYIMYVYVYNMLFSRPAAVAGTA
jgi:hypothetical protein